jgi:hypothetical protein
VIRDLLLTLVTLFVVEPFAAELNGSLAAARAPEPLVREVAACAGAAAPAVIERVVADPGWAVFAAVRLTTGMATAEAVILDAAPGCAVAVAEARRFLAAPRA